MHCRYFTYRQFVVEKSINKLLYRVYSNLSTIFHHHIYSSRNIYSGQKRYRIVQTNEFTKNVGRFTLRKKNVKCTWFINILYLQFVILYHTITLIIKLDFCILMNIETNYIYISLMHILTSKAI